MNNIVAAKSYAKLSGGSLKVSVSEDAAMLRGSIRAAIRAANTLELAGFSVGFGFNSCEGEVYVRLRSLVRMLGVGYLSRYPTPSTRTISRHSINSLCVRRIAW
jgi:hypothetical protein